MIYGLVWTADDSVVKIGYTSSPRDEPSIESVSSRMMSMQTGHWREMVCIAMAPGNHSRETAWHHEFDHYRVKGEWFLRYREVDAWCRKYEVAPIPVSELRSMRMTEHIARASGRPPLPEEPAPVKRNVSHAVTKHQLPVVHGECAMPLVHRLGCRCNGRSAAVRELDGLAEASRRIKAQRCVAPRICECATCKRKRRALMAITPVIRGG